MNLPARIDFGAIRVIEVAHEILGEETRERSTATEKHFGDHGGLFVNTKKNKWYRHGNETGGDALNLICFVKGCNPSAGVSWLRSRGYLNGVAPVQKRLVATYDYVSRDGEVLYHVDRFEPKAFSQWREINGVRVYGVSGGLYERRSPCGPWHKDQPRPGAEVRDFPAVTPVPYRLPELLASDDAPISICAGEKDVENLRRLGFAATCNHGGEGKWWSELTPYFAGRRAFLPLDNDSQGEKHQAVIGAALQDIASEIRVVRFPELPEGGDVSDFIAGKQREGQGDEAIRKTLAERFSAAPIWVPAPSKEMPVIAAPIGNAPTIGPAKTDKSQSRAEAGKAFTTFDTPFDSFDRSQGKPLSDIASPPLDAEGVPCGNCPSCGQGEFWRRPKFHRDHNPRGWACWFCSSPPDNWGVRDLDFCGVPDKR